MQQNACLTTAAGTLAIHSYDESHRSAQFDVPLWSLPDLLQTVKMHIFCRKWMFSTENEKNHKQRNKFWSENETVRNCLARLLIHFIIYI